VAARQTERLVAGEDLIDAGPAPGPASQAFDLLLDRVNSYLAIAVARMFTGDRGDEYLGLARLACEVGEDAWQAPVAASVVALLDRFERYSADHPHQDGTVTPGVQLIVAAALVARTPKAPVPDIGDEADVGEREVGTA
jgi:hypothetical protein